MVEYPVMAKSTKSKTESNSKSKSKSNSKSSENTSTDFPPKLMVVLSWLFLIATIIVLAIEKENKEVKIQAWQALIFKLASFVLWPVVWIMFILGFPAAGILSSIAGGGGFAFGGMFCCGFPLMLILMAFFQVLPWVAIIMILADREFKLPLVYGWAEKIYHKFG